MVSNKDLVDRNNLVLFEVNTVGEFILKLLVFLLVKKFDKSMHNYLPTGNSHLKGR